MAANALNAGNVPLTLACSGLQDVVLPWDLSGILYLPVCDDGVGLLLGLCLIGFNPTFTIDSFLSNELPCIADFPVMSIVKYWCLLPSMIA